MLCRTDQPIYHIKPATRAPGQTWSSDAFPPLPLVFLPAWFGLRLLLVANNKQLLLASTTPYLGQCKTASALSVVGSSTHIICLDSLSG